MGGKSSYNQRKGVYLDGIGKESTQSYIDNLMAYHCMPTLLKYKPSSLIRINKKKADNTGMLFAAIEKVIGVFDSQYTILYENDSMLLLLIYHRDALNKLLSGKSYEQFLNLFGYNLKENRLDNVMKTLSLRYLNYINNSVTEHGLHDIRKDSTSSTDESKSDLFPHEIGIILGYPIQDVEDYMKYKGRNYVLCGPWKVYNDTKNAYKVFDHYKKLRDDTLRLLSEGKSFQEIKLITASFPNITIK